MKARVTVMPKAAVLDPRASPSEYPSPTGTAGASAVRAGKVMEIELDSHSGDRPALEAKLKELCRDFLFQPCDRGFSPRDCRFESIPPVNFAPISDATRIIPPQARRRRRPRFAVIQFPGSNCDQDCVRSCGMTAATTPNTSGTGGGNPRSRASTQS